jgi:hypothetical protein
MPTSWVLEITVSSPMAVAERCWDAGSTIALDGDGDEAIFRVTDPLGRLVTLLPRRRGAAA